MKKFLLLLLIPFHFFAYSQESNKIKELGVIFGQGNNPGITYRIGKQNAVFRFSSLILNGAKSTVKDSDIDYNSYGAGIMFGKEFRTPISEKIWIRHGADITFAYIYNQSKQPSTYYMSSKGYTTYYSTYNYGGYGYSPSIETEQKINTYTPGINLVFGVNYNITNNLVIGFELLPYFRLSKSKNTLTTDSGSSSTLEETSIKYGIDSSSALLSIVLRL